MTKLSFIEDADANPLNKAMMKWIGLLPLPNPQDNLDPRLDRANTDLRGLPTAAIIAAGMDPMGSCGRLRIQNLRSPACR